MFNSHLKTLYLFLILCSIFFATHTVALAQCEGVYFKPTTRKVFTEKVRFYTDRDHYKDMTGDGKIDFVGLVRDPETKEFRTIYILPNDGAGGFGTPIQIPLPYAVSTFYSALQIADFDSDGDNDFFVQFYESPGTVIVYRNDGAGNFIALPPTILPDNEAIGTPADINDDGLADIFTSTTGITNHSYYRLANADGTFGSRVERGNNIILGDFNTDGKLDVAVIGGINDSYYLQIYYNQGNGVFVYGNVSILLDSNYPYLMAVKDFNNDGKSDLLFTSFNNNGTPPTKYILIINDGNNNFTKTVYEIADAYFPRATVNDFNGDGFLDILAASSDPVRYYLFTNDGAGGFIRRDYNHIIPGFYVGDFSGVSVGDIDGDDKSDFLRISNFTDRSSTSYQKVFNETQITILKNVCNQFGQTKIVDFDGNGRTDFAHWRASDGRWRFSQPPVANNITYNWGMTGDIPTPGDFDGDGKTDLAVYRPSNGFWYIRNSTDDSFLSVQFGVSEDKPVASDYNGDGRTDLAVYRPSTGTWYVLGSGTNQLSAEQFGAFEDKPVPEDYDGDGKTDIAVFRPSTGVWYYHKTSDGNYSGIQWGFGTDTPVPGDYDADGKADIAVVRSGAQSYWYILRSFDQQPAAIPFGTASDIPQAGDWDGNGILDLGSYRPSNLSWYTSLNLSSSQLGFLFGSNDEIPISTLNKNY